MDNEQHASLMEIGKSAYASIAEMVAALNCDYDRLEELRDERADLASMVEDAEDEEKADARAELAQWDEENAEELAELQEAAGECGDQDAARQRIEEDALSVEVRIGWQSPGEAFLKPEEFKILLTTGGPAVQIRGELDEHNEPSRAWLEVQDWFLPWTQYANADRDVLLDYARVFYFGE